MTAGIHGRMRRGAAWMVLLKLTERSLGLLSTLVLVRVLAPEDFGVVAMAMSFIAVAELVSAFGFDLALIQKQQADASHYNVAWTCNLLLGLTVTLAMLLVAQPIAGFYARPEVFWVVCALAFGPALGGAENIGVVAFRKELDFGMEFRFLLAKKLMAVAITIPLALWLRSYWALVAGMLFSRAAGTAISYFIHPFRPRLSLRRMGDLMVFSKWILVNNVIVLFKERSTDFVIGSSQGPRALGLFNLANEFANLPHTELAAPVNRALLPGFAKIQADASAVEDAFIGAVRMLALVVVPAAAIIHAVAPHLVPVLFGAKWLDATPLMQVLALAGGIIAMHSPLCALLIAHGHPSGVAACHLLYVGVLIAALFGLLPMFGALGAAYAVLCAATVSTPAYLLQVRRRLAIPCLPTMRAVVRPVVAAAAAVLAVRVLVPASVAMPPLAQAIASLAAALVVGVVVYLAAAAALWIVAGRPAGAEQFVLRKVSEFVAARRGAVP